MVPVDVDVLAVLPHAHYLAKEMQGLATHPNGRKEWLILIKDWNFNWQGAYRYAKPVKLPRGSTLSMQFTYDNSSENTRNSHNPPQRVTYGPQTTDEMAELWFQVLPRSQEDFAKLTQAFQKKMLEVFFERNQYLVRVNPENAEAHNKLGQALLGFGRTMEAVEHLRAAMKLRPDYEEPHFFLGYVLRDQKKLAQARTEYETVLRINPTNHEACGNLGLVCFEQGNLAEAEEISEARCASTRPMPSRSGIFNSCSRSGRGHRNSVRAPFMGSFNLQDWTRIGAMNLPSEFVLVPRPRARSFGAGTDYEDEGRGRAREHLAEERFMESPDNQIPITSQSENKP